MSRSLVLAGLAALLTLVLSSTSPAANATIPLGSLVIRLSDLRSGYVQNYAQSSSDPALSDRQGRTITLTTLRGHGYLTSFQASFQRPRMVRQGNSSHVESLLEETAYKFSSAAGARWAYSLLNAHRKGAPGPALGDQSRVYLNVPYECNGPKPASCGPWRGNSLTFQRRGYVVTITLFNTPLSLPPLISLAKLVDQRIERNG